MFLSRNKKNNVYPCKPQFYYIKVGFKGVNLYRYVFVMRLGSRKARLSFPSSNLVLAVPRRYFHCGTFYCPPHDTGVVLWYHSRPCVRPSYVHPSVVSYFSLNIFYCLKQQWGWFTNYDNISYSPPPLTC